MATSIIKNTQIKHVVIEDTISVAADASNTYTVSHNIDFVQWELLTCTIRSDWAWAVMGITDITVNTISYTNAITNTSAGTHNTNINIDLLLRSKI